MSVESELWDCGTVLNYVPLPISYDMFFCIFLHCKLISSILYRSIHSAQVCGSPMLDVSLGRENAVRAMLSEIGVQSRRKAPEGERGSKGGKKRRRNKGSDSESDSDEEQQLDDTLPPESDTRWIGCDECRQWRRLPWNVDAEDLVSEVV